MIESYPYYSSSVKSTGSNGQPQGLTVSFLSCFFLSSHQANQFFDIPNMIRQSRFHGRRNSERLVYSAKVIVHEMQGHGMTVILNLFRKAVRQPGKAAHPHAHCQVLTL